MVNGGLSETTTSRLFLFPRPGMIPMNSYDFW